MSKSVLRSKDYFLLFIGSVVSNLGTQIFNFAMSLYIYELTGDNAAAAGLFFSFGAVVFFVLSPFGGALVDRMDKVRVVYITDLLNGIVIFLAGYLILGGLSYTEQIYILYASSLVLGVNGALFNPAARALPAHILEPDQLQQSSSLQQGMQALYGIIGPIIGGIMYGLVENGIMGIEYIFIINGVSFILSGFSEMFIRVKTIAEQTVITIKGTLLDIKSGFQYLWNLKGIRNMLLFAAMINFFTVPVIVNGFPYLFKVQLDVNAVFYSIVMAAFPLGIIVSSVILGTQRQSEKHSPAIIKGLYGMSTGFLFFAIFTVLIVDSYIGFALYMVLAVISTIVTGYYNGFVNVPFSTAMMQQVDKEMMGRVFSVMGLISSGVTPIAIGIGGVVVQYTGINTLLFGAVIALFFTSFLTQQNKAVREI